MPLCVSNFLLSLSFPIARPINRREQKNNHQLNLKKVMDIIIEALAIEKVFIIVNEYTGLQCRT